MSRMRRKLTASCAVVSSGLPVPASMAANCARSPAWAGTSLGRPMLITKSMLGSFSARAAMPSTSACVACRRSPVSGSDCVYVTDPDTGERRQATQADVEGMAALAEKLPNIDFVMSMGLPSDVPAQAGDLAQFAAMLAGTGKPLLTTAHDAVSLRRMRDMAALCGEARSFACYAMPNPPLVHSAEALDKVQACAELDIPLVYAPAPAAGTTAPASIAATIVVGNAETLSGLVVHQLTRSGAPFVYGVGCGAFDMRTAVDVYGAPEHFLGNAAATDLARFYGLPSFAYAAVADAKTFDEQWAAEAGITAVLGALSRATLLHDVGYLESGMQSSYETIVLGDELVG